MKILSFIKSLLLTAVFFTVTASAQTTFTNSTSITINDNAPATPYPSSISVSGLSGTIAAAPGSVKVRLNNFSHTYPGDVAMVLVGPTGKAFLIQDSAGDAPMSNVTYTLSDDGATLLPLGAWTAGTYKPTAYIKDDFPAPGPGTNYESPATVGSASFSSVFGGTNPNGDWKLYILDADPSDSGSISGGWSLTITTASSSGGTPPRRANVDMNGDGKTDWVVTRGTTTPFTEKPNSNFFKNSSIAKSYRERLKMRKQNVNAATAGTTMYWYTNINGTGAVNISQFGTFENDFVIPKDFDGDGKDDIAVWRPATTNFASAFYILQSSNNTVRIDQFGMSGDDPTVTGDYDGDGKADPATFRCPDADRAAGQCYFFYRGSLSNPTGRITYVPFGFGTSDTYYANPGDFDGDGKLDFCLLRDGGGGAGQFVLLKSSNMGVEYINWGRVTDIIVPGDFDGDGKSDFMLTRNINGQLSWSLLTRTGGGTGASPIVWGAAATDFEAPGDYDGDGKTDIAVWRPNADPDQNYYYVRRSSDLTLQSFEWGISGDIPVQNWYVH